MKFVIATDAANLVVAVAAEHQPPGGGADGLAIGRGAVGFVDVDLIIASFTVDGLLSRADAACRAHPVIPAPGVDHVIAVGIMEQAARIGAVNLVIAQGVDGDEIARLLHHIEHAGWGG